MAPNQKCKAKLQQKLCAYISDEQVKSVKKQCVSVTIPFSERKRKFAII